MMVLFIYTGSRDDRDHASPCHACTTCGCQSCGDIAFTLDLESVPVCRLVLGIFF
uniref:Uncharacterized protein n=1 Tax=Arundo donax TaxID=35708 RepID=A0A0A9AVD2_ARUDO